MLGTHTSGYEKAGDFLFPLTESDDGGLRPGKLGRGSVSPASPRIFSLRERFAERFSEGVFTLTEDVHIKTLTAPFRHPPRKANVDTGTGKPG
jgi:hypothetical protein